MTVQNGAAVPLPAPFARSPGRAGWRKTLLLALFGVMLMAVGGVVGAGLSVMYFRSQMAPAPGSLARMGRLLNNSITDGVSLTAEEQGKIDAIGQTGVSDVEKLNQEYGSMIQGRFGDICKQICAVLGPERSKKWEYCVRRDFGDRAAQRIHGNGGGHE